MAAGAAVGDGRRGVFAAADDDGRGNREECERMHAARCKSHRKRLHLILYYTKVMPSHVEQRS